MKVPEPPRRCVRVELSLPDQALSGQAATAKPVVSSTPVLRLMHCTAAPEPPLPRLSSEAAIPSVQ